MNLKQRKSIPSLKSITQFMEISGKLVAILPMQTGNGKNGQWTKKEFVIETAGQYPKKLCFAVWGDKIQTDRLTLGQTLAIKCDVESREYNGKYFTEVKAFFVQAEGNAQATQKPDPGAYITAEVVNSADDLPF